MNEISSFYNSNNKGETKIYFSLYKKNDVKKLANLTGLNETFKDYIKYLSASTTFKSSYIMVMERCTTNDDDSKNKDDCKYAYLEIYDGKE